MVGSSVKLIITLYKQYLSIYKHNRIAKTETQNFVYIAIVTIKYQLLIYVQMANDKCFPLREHQVIAPRPGYSGVTFESS